MTAGMDYVNPWTLGSARPRAMGQLPGRVTRLPPLPPPPPGACLTLNNTALLCSACLPWRRKVAVLGAAGGIGQPLSLLLKMNRMITELSLYDIANVAGVAADLSHCNTNTKVGRVGLLGLVGLLGSVKVKAGGQCAAGQMMQEHACSHCVHSKLSQPAAHPPASLLTHPLHQTNKQIPCSLTPAPLRSRPTPAPTSWRPP